MTAKGSKDANGAAVNRSEEAVERGEGREEREIQRVESEQRS